MTDLKTNPGDGDKDSQVLDIFEKTKGLFEGGVLSNSQPGIIEEDFFRRYLGKVRSEVILNGKVDFNEKSVLYEIGLGKKSPQYHPGSGIPQNIKSSDYIDEHLASFQKKVSNFTARYDFMDLSAICFRLGYGIGHYVNSGKLEWNFLSGGKDLKLRGLNVADDPISASASGVFIPRLVDHGISPACFSAICACVNAYDAIVYSDVVTLDRDSNSPTINTSSGGVLASACLEAFRVILYQYKQFSAGSVAGLAFIKGLNTACTVVGHSDEGGLFRDILRCGDFRPPFGAVITVIPSEFNPFPRASHGDMGDLTTLVDSILLTFAGGISSCDPGVVHKGKTFPTVFTSPNHDHDPLIDNVGNDIYLSHLDKLGQSFISFVTKVNEFIGIMFGVDSDSKVGISFLSRAFEIFSSKFQRNPDSGKGKGLGGAIPFNRHLHNEAIAPFFWVEPTTLFKKKIFDSDDPGLFGPIAFTSQKNEMKMFDKLQFIKGDSHFGYYGIGFTSARTCGLLQHLTLHQKNGLGGLVPLKLKSDFVILPGCSDVRENIENKASITSYLWGRGQSSISPPSEFLYTGEGMVVRFLFSSYDGDFNLTASHLPRKEELDANVSLLASLPVRIPNGRISTFPKKVHVQRTTAARALEKAILIQNSMGSVHSQVILSEDTDFCFSADKEAVFAVNDIDQGSKGGTQLQKHEPEGGKEVKKGSSVKKVTHDQAMRPSSGKAEANFLSGGVVSSGPPPSGQGGPSLGVEESPSTSSEMSKLASIMEKTHLSSGESGQLEGQSALVGSKSGGESTSLPKQQ